MSLGKLGRGPGWDALLVLLLGSVVTAQKCDHYSFCSQPRVAHVHDGNFEFGDVFDGKTCVATQARAASFSFMTLNNSHANGTITTTMASDNNDYVAAVVSKLPANKTWKWTVSSSLFVCCWNPALRGT